MTETRYRVYLYRENDYDCEVTYVPKYFTKEKAIEYQKERMSKPNRTATYIVVACTPECIDKLMKWVEARRKARGTFTAKARLAKASEQLAKGKRFGGDIIKYALGEYDVVTA